VTAFRVCVVSEKYKNEIQADMMEAMRIGADGTPAFVVGKSTAEGIEGDLVVGAQPYSTFDLKLRSLGTK
jgi:predicted DsbA family dithiol-disulfide isomerase